jgi:hypothetical protein
MAKVDLMGRVDTLFSERKQNSATGLAVLNDCFAQIGSHKNADPFLRFVGHIRNDAALRGRVARMLRIAFNGTVGVKASKDKLSIVWDNFPAKVDGHHVNLAKSNSYAKIRDAVKAGKGWDDAGLYKDLKDLDPKAPAAPKKLVDDKAVAKKAASVVDSLERITSADFTMADLLNAITKEVTRRSVEGRTGAPALIDGEPAH